MHRGGAPDRSTDPPAGRRRAACGAVLLGLAAFLLTAAGVRRLVPWPNEYLLQDKLAWFVAHQDEYDVLYLGSSQVLCSFQPVTIDRELAKRGHDVRSFNLGAAGLDAFGAEALLREVLARDPARLRFVVMEWLSYDGARVLAGEPFTAREVRWHAPAVAAMALRRAAQSPRLALGERLRLAWRHVRGAARHLGNHGQGPLVVQRWRDAGPERRRMANDQLEREQGFRTRWNEEQGAVERLLALRPDPVELAARTAPLDAANAVAAAGPAGIDGAASAALDRLVRAAGGERLVVIPPVLAERAEVYRLHESGRLPHLLAFNSPARYPELYAPSARADSAHLSREGAEVFSRRFAEGFARWLDEH